jgi:putative ABC transport system substrate-binding protein
MKRRAILTAPLASAVAFHAAESRAAEHSIGWISPESRETTAPFFAAFSAGLKANLPAGTSARVIERYVTGGSEAIAAQVSELQQQGVSLIVAQGAATVPVARARSPVPIVFGFSGDPVAAGIAQSFARPGGNATGVSFMSIELIPKRISLLRTALPQCSKVALLSNARHPGEENEIAACQKAVASFGIDLATHRVRVDGEMTAAVAAAIDGGAQALVMLPSSFMVKHAPQIAAQCLLRKVPVVSGWSSIARAGGLLTYGPNLAEAYRRVAFYVVRVLGGAPPSSLPIEQPSVFELAINMRTAKALGITLPATLLAQADEVIE